MYMSWWHHFGDWMDSGARAGGFLLGQRLEGLWGSSWRIYIRSRLEGLWACKYTWGNDWRDSGAAAGGYT